jgi:hypothetical protein
VLTSCCLESENSNDKKTHSLQVRLKELYAS